MELRHQCWAWPRQFNTQSPGSGSALSWLRSSTMPSRAASRAAASWSAKAASGIRRGSTVTWKAQRAKDTPPGVRKPSKTTRQRWP